MIGRAIWIAAIALIAAATALVQLDRQARINPSLSASVPQPFRAFAQEDVAREALRRGEASVALAEARRLIARRPLPAEHLSLLAAAQHAHGDVEQAAITIQLAAKRGWRDRPAQEAMLRLALAAGDRAEAARRFAALLIAPRSDDAMLAEVAPAIFDAPNAEGTSALVEVLAGEPRWQHLILTRGTRVMPAEALGRIATEAASQGVPFDCDDLRSAEAAMEHEDEGRTSQLDRVIANECEA